MCPGFLQKAHDPPGCFIGKSYLPDFSIPDQGLQGPQNFVDIVAPGLVRVWGEASLPKIIGAPFRPVQLIQIDIVCS